MLGRNGHQNAAACRAVKLGHDKAVDASDILENLDLIECILAGGCIQGLENRVWGFRIVFAKNTNDLGEFVHQFGLVLQTACSVDDKNIAARIFGLLPCIIGKARCIGPELARNNRGTGALAPDMELFDGGSAESIACRKHDLEAASGQFCGKLADGRGLAGAIDADNQNDMRLVREIKLQRLCDRPKHLFDFRAHDVAHFFASHVLAITTGRQRIGHTHGRFKAEIGLNEHVFKILQRVLIELALGEDTADGIAQ